LATPFTNLRLVANRHNEDEIGRIEEMARELGVGLFSDKSLGCLPDRNEFTDFLPDARDMRRFGAARTRRASTFRCSYPFRQPTVFWDGTVGGRVRLRDRDGLGQREHAAFRGHVEQLVGRGPEKSGPGMDQPAGVLPEMPVCRARPEQQHRQVGRVRALTGRLKNGDPLYQRKSRTAYV
jgi:hypothetical protein